MTHEGERQTGALLCPEGGHQIRPVVAVGMLRDLEAGLAQQRREQRHAPVLVEALAEHEPGVGLVLVDHRAVDAMDLLEVVGVGDVGEHRAPHHRRHAELMVDVDRGDGDGGAIMGDAADHVAVGRRLGGDLHRHVRLALVVEDDRLVGVFRLGVGVAQLHREVRRVAAAQTDGGIAAAQRADEGYRHLVLRERDAGNGKHECGGSRRHGRSMDVHGGFLAICLVARYCAMRWRESIAGRRGSGAGTTGVALRARRPPRAFQSAVSRAPSSPGPGSSASGASAPP